MDEGVHHELRVLNVLASDRPPCVMVDIYGGPENVCGAVTLMPADLTPKIMTTLRRWRDEETALTVIVGKGRIVLTEGVGYDQVTGWRTS